MTSPPLYVLLRLEPPEDPGVVMVGDDELDVLREAARQRLLYPELRFIVDEGNLLNDTGVADEYAEEAIRDVMEGVG